MARKNLAEKLINSVTALRTLVFQNVYGINADKTATMLQFSALNFLKHQSKVTVGDLAGFLRLSKSSATQLISRLKKAGLVKKAADKEDKRIIHLTITPKGEKQLSVLKRGLIKKVEGFLTKIPQKDISELIRIHGKLIENLKGIKDENN